MYKYRTYRCHISKRRLDVYGKVNRETSFKLCQRKTRSADEMERVKIQVAFHIPRCRPLLSCSKKRSKRKPPTIQPLIPKHPKAELCCQIYGAVRSAAYIPIPHKALFCASTHDTRNPQHKYRNRHHQHHHNPSKAPAGPTLLTPMRTMVPAPAIIATIVPLIVRPMPVVASVPVSLALTGPVTVLLGLPVPPVLARPFPLLVIVVIGTIVLALHSGLVFSSPTLYIFF